MSVTKFAFLPPKSAGAVAPAFSPFHFHIFSFDSMLNTSPIWCLPLQDASPYSYTSERMQQSHQTARLNYWVTDASLVFETMQEEETKILSPLLLIPNSWLETLALYKPRGSSWRRGAQFLRHEPFLLMPENKSYLSISSQLCLHIFHAASVGREGQNFGRQQYGCYP